MRSAKLISSLMLWVTARLWSNRAEVWSQLNPVLALQALLYLFGRPYNDTIHMQNAAVLKLIVPSVDGKSSGGPTIKSRKAHGVP